MRPADVENWIRGIIISPNADHPDVTSQRAETPAGGDRGALFKRRRRLASPLTPPKSARSMSQNAADGMTPATKRRRMIAEVATISDSSEDELGLCGAGGARAAVENGTGTDAALAFDADATPRAPRRSAKASPVKYRHLPQAGAASPTISGASSTSSTSNRSMSTTSSPRKRMRALEVAFEPVEVRPLVPDMPQDMPQALAEFCSQLFDISQGVGVLGDSTQDSFMEHSNPAMKRVASVPRHFSAARDHLGPTPSIDCVLSILISAQECQKYPEISWNLEVHAPVLSLALRPPGSPPFSQPCGFVACHPARIIKEYLNGSVPDKMIDFCLYLDPEALKDRAAVREIELTRQSLAGYMINHTDYDPLRKRPLTLSIETKKPGEGLENATLQVGAWHAAQWRFLDAMADRLGEDSTSLSFLPAIIIQGHDWNFAATTREGNKTVLWLKQTIGSTNSVLGIYQIVTALQSFRRWTQKTYWPWFRATVLGLPSSP
ncbi:hypothetical protein NKR23_g11418 [Pleurostoma richardsiae]|uniref:PD-(D/E)XK nuclease-like domain-containing protein n=1 Tax=Pleurostoma richardsiae TaxID=41990 RepID=A0AA38VGV6_9PEZI|nr:hypothetical protein NKR23_g11418 [Pleurostoma richardsiae]